MAVLRGLWVRGRGRRLTEPGAVRCRSGPGRALLIGMLVSLACGRADDHLRPDAMLRDSLGLGDDDRVHRIWLASVANNERIDPDRVEIRQGDYVEFVTDDRRVHAVAFTLDSLSLPASEFLSQSGQQGSPPLVDAGARFVVSFTGAPTSRYPFVVVGNGAPGRGLVVVSEPKR